MKINILDLIDFDKIDILLEGFNKSTGFVTAILDLEGKVLSKSGWRQMCTHFHRVNPETSKKCTISDTILAGKLAAGEKYHFYKCLNGLVDVAVPIVINGEHIANLFSGQFFFEEPDRKFFKNQAEKYGFDEEEYLKALEIVPVVSEEKVKTAMDFLLNMTQMISEMTFQKLEQTVLNEDLQNSKEYNRSLFTESSIGMLLTAINGKLIDANPAFCKIIGRTLEETLNLTYWDITPEKYSLQEAEQLKSLETNGNYGPYEKEYIHKDGYLVSVRLQGNIMERKGQKYIWSSVEDITERKKGEIRLRDEKEQKRIILELVGDPIFLKDNDHRIIFANQAFFDLFGLNEKSVIGKTLAENVPENEQKHFLEIDRNVLDTGIPDYREEELTVGKQTNTIITRKTRFIDESGNRFLVGSIHNITERKMAEDRLKKSEHNLSEAERIGNTGSWEYDVASDTASWSENMFHIFDVDQEMPTELVFKHFVDNLVHPEDRPHILSIFVDALSGKRPYDLEYRVIKNDGTYRNIHAIAETLLDENGKAIRMIGKVEDITERKLAEKELKESQFFFEQLFIQSSTSTQLLDSEGWCVKINPKLSELFGVNPEDIEGKKYNILQDGEIIRTGVINHLNRVFKNKETIKWEVNFDIQHASETTGVNVSKPEKRWFHNLAYPIINANGELIYVIIQHEDITERKQAEVALAESEERFRKIFEEGPLGMVMASLSAGKPFRANKAFCDMLGYSEEELCQLTFLDFTYPDDQGNDVEAVKNLREGRIQKYNTEKRYQKKNGELIWGALALTKIYSEKDQTYYALAMIEDITLRKLTEEKLQENLALFRIAGEKAKLGGWSVNLKENRAYWSDEVAAIHEMPSGYSPLVEEGINFYAPEWRDKITKVLTDCAQKGIPFDEEMEIITGTGKRIWIQTIGESVRNEAGEIIKVQGAFHDISKRIQDELSLRESEERFRKIFEEGPLGMAMASLSTGELLSVNKAICTMLGYTKEEILQFTFKDFTYPDDLENDVEAVKNLIEGRIQKHYTEKRYLKKNGEVFWGARALTKIYSEKDQAYYALAMIEDITQRKMAEAEIKKLNEELEMKVKLRTSQLEASIKELETFTYSVSHDLKAPLRGIDGYSKLLLDLYKPGLNEEAQIFIETIRRSTLQMNQLINDLLDYSRLERSQLSTEHVKIKDLVKSVLSIYNADLEAGNFKINVNIPDIELITDSKGLTIALRNLVENAIKFTKGNIEPSIQIDVEEKDLAWIISVNDNGIGFDMKYHQKIFEIFQRLQRVEEFPGTGIGLAMVSKAMQRMHGRAWAESTLGAGSSFYLEIPKKQ